MARSVFVLALCWPADIVLGADPQPYTTIVTPTGEAELDAAISASSGLLSLQKTHVVGPFALAGRIRNDYGRLRIALESYGYYAPTIRISVRPRGDRNAPDAVAMDGTDPRLPEWLQAIPKGQVVQVTVTPTRGEIFRLGRVTLVRAAGDGTGPVVLNPAQSKALGVASGQPAVASDVLAGATNLQAELKEEGHALARVDPPKAWLRPDTHTLDIEYTVRIGPVVTIGAITLSGMRRTHPAYIARRMTMHPDDLYQPSRIESARQDLAGLGVFSNVQVNDAPPLTAGNQMPLSLNFTEGKVRTVAVQGGYSTDLGGRAGVSWTHRNIFGNAERLRLTALVTGLGGSAQQGLGYDVYADLMKPDFGSRDQNLSVRVEGIRQLLYSYRQTALLVRAGVVRRLGRLWTVSFEGQAEQEQIEQMGQVNDYTIISLPLGATYDSTGLSNPIDPATHGFRLAASVTPSASLLDGTSFFTIMQANASTYFDLTHLGLSRPGRSVIAVRGIVGSVQGASTFDIPPDQRLYAGGSATVRGFRYQGVGPQFPNSKYAIGGTSMDAASLEFRQRLFRSFGGALFADAGQVGTGSRPFQGTLRVGVGAGVRYYTPIGPVRVDIAVPLNRPNRGDTWELYLGLGETF
ncbi:autotransporter assembly complex protein TamA [Gluconacetobacter sacchari]|uniref:BamA/TamA family outer membrane protein n=1 Tax=Gluconacetobacter sacchari TaxID=92759 RepID=A0A7W4NPP5_9PROT|nr:BamA/TamA family outer membrane protein [Gluconacetobacter sacchari]MBB2161742.1 BamA/TamA family outer membrane protein [Gluconacetobacter sacchari]